MKSAHFFNNRKRRREKVLRKMQIMRDAKARKCADCAPPPAVYRERYPLQLGIRNKLTGETAWVDFRSVRDAAKRLAVIKAYYLHQ